MIRNEEVPTIKTKIKQTASVTKLTTYFTINTSTVFLRITYLDADMFPIYGSHTVRLMPQGFKLRGLLQPHPLWQLLKHNGSKNIPDDSGSFKDDVRNGSVRHQKQIFQALKTIPTGKEPKKKKKKVRLKEWYRRIPKENNVFNLESTSKWWPIFHQVGQLCGSNSSPEMALQGPKVGQKMKSSF